MYQALSGIWHPCIISFKLHTLQCRYCYCHCPDEKTEVQRSPSHYWVQSLRESFDLDSHATTPALFSSHGQPGKLRSLAPARTVSLDHVHTQQVWVIGSDWPAQTLFPWHLCPLPGVLAWGSLTKDENSCSAPSWKHLYFPSRLSPLSQEAPRHLHLHPGGIKAYSKIRDSSTGDSHLYQEDPLFAKLSPHSLLYLKFAISMSLLV